MTKAQVKPANKAGIKLITDKAKLDAAIASIANRGAKLDKDINIAAISAMAHHAKHGDVTIVNNVVAAMPKGSRVNALRDFILAHGKVTWNDETNEFQHDKGGAFDLEGALEKPWTEYKPEALYRPFDAIAAVKAMVKRVNALDVGKGDKCTKDQAKAIMALATAMGVEVKA